MGSSSAASLPASVRKGGAIAVEGGPAGAGFAIAGAGGVGLGLGGSGRVVSTVGLGSGGGGEGGGVGLRGGGAEGLKPLAAFGAQPASGRLVGARGGESVGHGGVDGGGVAGLKHGSYEQEQQQQQQLLLPPQQHRPRQQFEQGAAVPQLQSPFASGSGAAFAAARAAAEGVAAVSGPQPLQGECVFSYYYLCVMNATRKR